MSRALGAPTSDGWGWESEPAKAIGKRCWRRGWSAGSSGTEQSGQLCWIQQQGGHSPEEEFCGEWEQKRTEGAVWMSGPRGPCVDFQVTVAGGQSALTGTFQGWEWSPGGLKTRKHSRERTCPLSVPLHLAVLNKTCDKILLPLKVFSGLKFIEF